MNYLEEHRKMNYLQDHRMNSHDITGGWIVVLIANLGLVILAL